MHKNALRRAVLVLVAALMVVLGTIQTASATPQGATTVVTTTASSEQTTDTSVSTEEEVQATACDQPIFIGIRGSGESPQGSKLKTAKVSDPANMGEPVKDTYEKFASIVSDAIPYSLLYPAVPIEYKKREFWLEVKYLNSVGTGAKSLEAKLTSIQNTCQGLQQVVIVAYSQGASVLTHAFKNLYFKARKKCHRRNTACVKANKTANGILNGIVGVVRLAPPKLYVDNQLFGNILGVPVEKRRNYCLPSDPICHWNKQKLVTCDQDCAHYWYSNGNAAENGAETFNGGSAACDAGRWLAERFGQKPDPCKEPSSTHPTPTPEPVPTPDH